MFQIHSGIIDCDSEYCDHCQLQQVFYVLDNVQTWIMDSLLDKQGEHQSQGLSVLSGVAEAGKLKKTSLSCVMCKTNQCN